MATHEEVIKSFERQSNFIRDQLLHKNYNEAITGSELLSTYLKIKISELNKKDGE